MVDFLLIGISFLSGVLTVLAPCVLPLLPVIIGGSLSSQNKYKPYLIILGLLMSLILFTLLLKASTILIQIDPQIWKNISGGIVVIFGLTYLFPAIWDKISVKLKLSANSDKLLDQADQKEGWVGNILVGAALGPVFASCSPTYALIIATILPVNFLVGLVYIISYSLGLAAIMLAIALLGKKVLKSAKFFANPNGWFKKTLGVIFIVVGIGVITGFDKVIETNILNSGFFDITQVEKQILENNRL